MLNQQHLTLIDRQDQLRKNDTELLTLWNQPNARVLPVLKGKCLIRTTDSLPHLEWVGVQNSWRFENAIFLGTTDAEGAENSPWFAINVDEDSISPLKLPNDTEFQDLRVVGPHLTPDDSALLKYAKGLTFWHSTTRYCSSCGSNLTNTQGGHTKQCSNEQCQQLVFPRTDPAVIMLVTRTDAAGEEWCLLGRSPVWPPGMYSTLAGFVESGESLEQAVAREVYEESGVRVQDVQYISSQPWPFPRSIMLGFRAVATTEKITLDVNELEDARWFTRADLENFGAWGDANFEFQLPRTDSIAYALVTQWLKG